MNEILKRQLALDYCCTPEEAGDRKNHFTLYTPLEGRRRYKESEDCYLKFAVVNGKLLFTGREDIVRWCEERWADEGGAWFAEPKNLRVLNDRMHADGYQIGMLHPFYIADAVTDPGEPPFPLTWYEREDIEAFRGDERWREAYSFNPPAPDVLGVSASEGGRLLGMAGASRDSLLMWQIGINVESSAEGRGIGTCLVEALKNEILRRGALPFYGTSFSHHASQRVALGAGFLPAWVEMASSPL